MPSVMHTPSHQALFLLQVRLQLQRLPGSPAQATCLATLCTAAAELKSKAAKLEARAVPRPAPPQYAQLVQSVQHFLAGSGSVPRMKALLLRLEVTSPVLVLQQHD